VTRKADRFRNRPQSGPPARRPRGARLPETAVVQITGTDPDGDALARPVGWDSADGPPPLILMAPEVRGRPALAPGERVLARLTPIPGNRSAGPDHYEGRTLRRLEDAPARVLGVFKPGKPNGRIVPTDAPKRSGRLALAKTAAPNRMRSCWPNRFHTASASA
jgi:ribonuclease R